MIRRAPKLPRSCPGASVLRVLPVLLVLPLASLAATPSITHRCENEFFQYVEGHPIGSSPWHYDIPPAFIPGSFAPSNASFRLTADTRLAFTGAFDAYFRRLMASVAFGTAECTGTVARASSYGSGASMNLTTADAWRDDNTITNIFLGRADGWYLATNRNYAVTNVAVVVSNWVGYVTNVVYVSGKPRVKVSNRYDVTTTNVLDTTRILRRYLRDHNYMRGQGLNPIRGMMVSEGYDYFSNPAPAPWPDRATLVLGSPQYVDGRDYDGWIESDDFLGWTFSAVAGPYMTPTAEWQQSLVGLFQTALAQYNGDFSFFYPTTWDLFGAPNSRYPIAHDIQDNPGFKYLDYDNVCWEEWEGFLDYLTTGQGLAGGYAAMTNLVGVDFSTNTTDGLEFLPSTPLTNTARIVWAPWAGTDAYLALCDTSIAGANAMPHLHYDVAGTGGIATVAYRGKPGDFWLTMKTYPVDAGTPEFHRVYEVTNDTFELVRDGDATWYNGYGVTQETAQRIELAKFDLGNGIGFRVTAMTHIEDGSDPNVGHNYYQWDMSEAKSWINDYIRILQYAPTDGEMYSIGSEDGNMLTEPYFYITGPWGSIDSSWGLRPFNGLYYLDFRATNVLCEVSVPAESATTLRVKDFDRTLAATNLMSYPCIYPSRVYTDDGIDALAGIYPTVISAVGVATNFSYDVDNVYETGEYIMPETNGYYFAMRSGNALASVVAVDNFWLGQDALMAEKMGEEVAALAGVNPRTEGGVLAGFAEVFDWLLTGEGNTFFARMLQANITNFVSGAVTQIDDEWYPSTFKIQNVQPSSTSSSGYDFDLVAMEWDTNTLDWVAISPQPTYVRHLWKFAFGGAISTNINVGLSFAAARGRLSGLEAVKWDFKAMHDAQSTQASAPLRVLPGGAPAADSLTTQPPNR